MIIIDQELTFQKRDEYNRQPIAEKVIRLLKSDTDISPMVIDGNWGSGKTEFITKLINLFKINPDSYKLIYIDAFRADHADEPLMTLISAILNLLPENNGKLRKKALAALKFGGKSILKAGVGWVLRQDATDLADGFDSDIQAVCDQTIKATVDSLLKEHQEADDNIENLKIALAEITKESPIVIFIDELDRCRPNFAINMLEKIKHVFDVTNIQIVLVANKEQLRCSIKHCYGEHIKAQKYLDKFFKFSFSLPQSKTNAGDIIAHYPLQHYFSLINNSDVLEQSELSKMSYDEFIFSLFTINEISFREVETFVRYIEIFHTLSDGFNNINIGDFLLKLLGIFIFCFEPELKKEISLNRYDANKLCSLFGVEKYKHDGTNSRLSRIKFITSLIYLEANINGFKENKNFGITDVGITDLHDKIDLHFSGTTYYGESGKISLLHKAINSLELT